jgi:hypothetical protein
LARASRLLALALVAGALVSVAVPAGARADGDPASDVLYTQNVFIPFDTKSSKGAQTALATAIANAKRAGYPIRVAVIETIPDLGAVTSLWGKPKEYARFLDLELVCCYKGPLLIVMPSGIGFAHYKKGTEKEYRRLASIPVEKGGDGLALTAAKAVVALSTQAGHPIATPVVPKTKAPSELGQRLLAGGVVLALVLILLGGFALVRRRSRARA